MTVFDLPGYLLEVLGEECAEIIQRASKIKRFGLNEVQPGTNEGDNRERLAQEIDDFLAVRSMLEEMGVIRAPSVHGMAAKRLKVKKFADYSRERGTLKAVEGRCPECKCEPPGHKIGCKTGNERAARYQRTLPAKQKRKAR
jgi:hypothetical protein